MPRTTRQSARKSEPNLIEKREHSQGKTETNKRRKKVKSLDLSINFILNDLNDKVVEDLRNKHVNLPIDQQASIGVTISNHIALEGLDGLTLKRLFSIIKAIYPNFNVDKDEKLQNHIWSILKTFLANPTNANIQAFYLKPGTTKDLENGVSCKGVILDKAFKLPLQTLKRFANFDSMIYPVQDGHIMGSCAFYLSRQDITEDLVERFTKEGCRESMYSINNDYNLDNIYFVACQTIRIQALYPSCIDPNLNIKLREYCILELIGKSRTLGTVFPNDKALGRYRIMLVAKNLITQYQETASHPIEHHLKRFSSTRNKGFVQQGVKDKSKVESKRASNLKIENNGDKSDGDLDIPSQSEDEDEDEDGDNENSSNSRVSLSKLCCNPLIFKPDRSMLSMVYEAIARSDKGLTQLDIRRKLNLPKFHVRNHLKNLISIQMIWSEPVTIENPFRRYKTAHKTRRRKKRAPSGIMAKWDDRDLKAKRNLGHKRSSFNQAEDSLLILCRIASVLIDPGLKLSWCVHKRLIRDVLHDELIESHDKTSDACLRRIKYLKKLPNNIMSINELTAELRDDAEIKGLIQSKVFKSSCKKGKKLRRLFVALLKTIKTKIPNLLGIASSVGTINKITTQITPTNIETTSTQLIHPTKPISIANYSQADVDSRLNDICDYDELKRKYEFIDCQSVASIVRAPTYEQAKNIVDIKLNNAALVTMAYTLSSSFSRHRCEQIDEEVSSNKNDQERTQQWLLDKFYSTFPDKLISSVLSKLSKRSLVTRKSPVEGTYKPKTKMSLKLNQSVLFLLNRYHSCSLIQLAHPISPKYKIDLSESNDMASFALLTSLYSLSSFNLDLNLKVPANVVDIDRGNLSDCLIVQPCKVRFNSEDEIKVNKEPLENFLSEAKPLDVTTGEDQQQMGLNKMSTNWLVNSFRFATPNQDSTTVKDFEAPKVQVKYHARLWKRVDGEVDKQTLFKLIESLLSWIIVYPGIDRKVLEQEFSHLMPVEHLFELLDLMKDLNLISGEQVRREKKRPRLFGYCDNDDRKSNELVNITYEAKGNAFLRYCQLMDECK